MGQIKNIKLHIVTDIKESALFNIQQHGCCKTSGFSVQWTRRSCFTSNFTSSVQSTHSSWCCSLCSLQHGKELSTTLRRTQTCWSPDLSWIVGNRSCCGSYSSCPWWRYASIRSGCLRKHVPRWTYVRSYQNLAKMAPTHQPEAKKICHLFCFSCQCHSFIVDGSRSPSWRNSWSSSCGHQLYWKSHQNKSSCCSVERFECLRRRWEVSTIQTNPKW